MLIVYSTYYMNDSVAAELSRVRESGLPCIVSSDVSVAVPNGIPFTAVEVSEFPYGLADLWLNIELHMIAARRRWPGHDHYWYVEHDVRYTGDWGEVFRASESSEADLIATYIEPFSQKNIGWCWWSHAPANCPTLHRAFLPLWRISRRAIDLLDYQYQRGRHGYCEVAIPSLLAEARMDLCELSRFGMEYDHGSFTWLRKPGTVTVNASRQNRLFHPVRTIG